MTNNDILRRLRYVLNATNNKMVTLFELGGLTVNEPQLLAWLKRDDDAEYQACKDKALAHFLNGLIADKRGVREGVDVPVENELNNNIIMRKLKIAFNLKADDLLELLEDANFRLGKAELSAFFRKPDHKHYRDCKDQVLRNLLKGLQLRYRPEAS